MELTLWGVPVAPPQRKVCGPGCQIHSQPCNKISIHLIHGEECAKDILKKSPDSPQSSIFDDLRDILLGVNCYRLMPGAFLTEMSLLNINQLLIELRQRNREYLLDQRNSTCSIIIILSFGSRTSLLAFWSPLAILQESIKAKMFKAKVWSTTPSNLFNHLIKFY